MEFKARRDSLSVIYYFIYLILVLYLIRDSYINNSLYIIPFLIFMLVTYQLSFFRKKYIFNSDFIKIFDGLKSKKIHYKNILSYEPKSSIIYNPFSRYSLSKDGVELVYLEKNKEETIFISPIDETLFLESLSSYIN